MNTFTRNLVIWGLIALAMLTLFNMFSEPYSQTRQMVPYSEFLAAVDSNNVREVNIQNENIIGTYQDGTVFQTYAPNDPGLVGQLLESNVLIRAEAPDKPSFLFSMLLSWFPMLLLIGVWLFFMNKMQGGNGKAMSFGRSRAKVLNQEQGRITFADVAGVDEAKEELAEIVEFLANPKKFTRLGGRIPKGVLLIGPPGTGKTLLARAVAGEAGVPFFSISGSDFVEMFVGVGASRVRDLFLQGKKSAPCLIFIDEIDAVGRQRGAGLGGGHDEREQTLNQLLVEMDGFESNEGVILIAATNRPDVLDPALLRPGRFDRQVMVSVPDLRGRESILKVHTRRTPLAPDVNILVLAKGSPGFSGADLENLVNEAALQAAKHDKAHLEMVDFEYAKDKVLMGKERRSLILSDDEKRITAYHEAGHALVAMSLKGADPVHKVSIIPRGRSLGVTMQLPEEDRHGYSRSYLRSNLVILIAGRVAEELIMDDITTGAGNDIERASKMARKMVCEWGMSDVIGAQAIGSQHEEVFLGREWGNSSTVSETTARTVDAEIKEFLDKAHSHCRELLEGKVEFLHAIASALLERETISGEDIKLILAREPLPPFNIQSDEKSVTKDGKDSKDDENGDEFTLSTDSEDTPDTSSEEAGIAGKKSEDLQSSDSVDSKTPSEDVKPKDVKPKSVKSKDVKPENTEKGA